MNRYTIGPPNGLYVPAGGPFAPPGGGFLPPIDLNRPFSLLQVRAIPLKLRVETPKIKNMGQGWVKNVI